MPNSRAVMLVLLQDVLGNQLRDGRTDTYLNMPNDMHDAVEEAAYAILERIARAVDWERLLEEAYWRHDLVHPDKQPDAHRVTTSEVCGECLMEALINDQNYSPNWTRRASTPLTRNDLDWPAVVADALRYRPASDWHPYKDQETPK